MTGDVKVWDELARLGVATIYEASGRCGLVDADLVQITPGSRVAGPARTVLCGQGDNRAVHAAMARVQQGEVLVLTMPSPVPVALVGELLATQAKAHGAIGMLVDAAVRDVEALCGFGLPIWCRWVRSRGATKSDPGRFDEAVTVAGARICPDDVVVLDSDGAVVVERARVAEVLRASKAREERERVNIELFAAGQLSYDMYGMRAEDQERAAAVD